MSRIFWDTMLFVYWLEDHPQFGPRVRTIFDRLREREDQLCTSALAVGEALVAPCKRGADQVIEYMEQFLASGVQVLPFTESTAIHFAKIRARYSIHPADAVSLACAAEARTDLFITNDASLAGKSVAGIQFIVDLNTNLF